MNRFLMLRSRLWARHPSFLWHYPATYVRHLRSWRSAAPIAAEFEKAAADGLFAERWFDAHIVPWHTALSRVFDRNDPLNILEIGSWEGRSTLFLLTYFPRATVTAVDTWEGNAESAYTATDDLADLEARFDHNTGGRAIKHRGLSGDVLPRLVAEGQRFDLIYVDGSHYADDVLTDAIAAWRLLNPGGVVIFDDVLWRSYPRWRANPGWAISTFLGYRRGDYRILAGYYQIVIQKIRSHDDRVKSSFS